MSSPIESRRYCVKKSRCVARDSVLGDEHFRKGSHGYSSTVMRKTCCFCIGLDPIQLLTPRSRHRLIECRSCGFSFNSPSFRDDRGRNRIVCQHCLQKEAETSGKRSTPPPRTPSGAGLTPSAVRAQKRTREAPPSPSLARQAVLLARPIRARRRPARPLDTQPTPEESLARRTASPIRRNRHAGQRRCNVCDAWKAEELYGRDRDGNMYRGCSTCLAARRAVRAARYRSQRSASSSRSSSPRPSPFTEIPASPADINAECLTPEAINCINNFHQALEDEQFQTCDFCKERWFGMKVEGGRCGRCRQSGHLWGASNHMDPGRISQCIEQA